MEQDAAISMSPEQAKTPANNRQRRTLLLTGASRGLGHAPVKRFSAAGWRVLTRSRHPLPGASRGIGHATVKRFSAAGWRVITCSRHPFPENCPWEAGPEDHIQVDLADPDDTLAAINEIKQRIQGELHALVNNAGISPKLEGGKRLDTVNTEFSVWLQVFQVNFFAPLMLARGLVKELEAAKGS